MSLQSAFQSMKDSGFPRVSGDEPWVTGTLVPGVQFSPRERG